MLDLAKNINLDVVKPQRGGGLFYYMEDQKLYFGLGRDAKTGEITDFAGGIKYKRNENAITGSIREFNEETLNICELKVDEAIYFYCIYDINNITLLIPVINKQLISSTFNEMKTHFTSQNLEVTDIIWLTEEELFYLLNHTDKIYKRFGDFFKTNFPFFSLNT